MRANHAQSSLCSKSYLPCSHSVQKASPRGEENCKQFGALATDEVDKPALTKSIHALRAPLTDRARSRTFCRRAPPNPPKNFPVRQPPPEKQESFSLLCGGCRAGKFGESGRGLGREGNPSERGFPPSPRSFPKFPLPPPLPWQGVQALRGWKGFSDAEHRGKAHRRPS